MYLCIYVHRYMYMYITHVFATASMHTCRWQSSKMKFCSSGCNSSVLIRVTAMQHISYNIVHVGCSIYKYTTHKPMFESFHACIHNYVLGSLRIIYKLHVHVIVYMYITSLLKTFCLDIALHC